MKILAVSDPGDFQARMEALDRAKAEQWEREILEALSEALDVEAEADKKAFFDKLRHTDAAEEK